MEGYPDERAWSRRLPFSLSEAWGGANRLLLYSQEAWYCSDNAPPSNEYFRRLTAEDVTVHIPESNEGVA
jgi:hypothetical protein